MSHEDVPYEDSLDRIRAWVHRSIYPRPASSAAVHDALVTVLSGLADAHLDRFLARSPAVISLPSMCVAIVLWGDDPTSPMPTRGAPLILFNTLLWPDQDALEYAVALTVAGIIAGRLGNASTPQEQQEQVHHLLRSWGYSVPASSVPASIEGRDCRLKIEIVSERPGLLVIGLQPCSDDDTEAFRPEWPS